jgi:hypothetical protein
MENKIAFGLVVSVAALAMGIPIFKAHNPAPAPVTQTQGVTYAETLRMADEAALERIEKQVSGTPTWEGPAFDEIRKEYR